MNEMFGNVWDHADKYDVVVVTTNGYVKSDGDAVMGRGIAKEATERYPGIAKTLGDKLKSEGNYPHVLVWDKPTIVSMPVKPRWGPNGEMGWKAKADLVLIQDSALILREMADQNGWKNVLLPRPGCGNGGLKWENVKPVIEEIFDDRFTVMTFEPL